MVDLSSSLRKRLPEGNPRLVESRGILVIFFAGCQLPRLPNPHFSPELSAKTTAGKPSLQSGPRGENDPWNDICL